jgi:PPOX class probable F420-dependent enzyme
MMVGVQTPLSGRQRSAVVPDSHRDLLDCPPVAALTTLMPDGSPHTTPVWCEFDGVHVPVNTMRGFLKERNTRRNPRVTLLCYDPAQTLRSLEVRGRVIEMTEEGAAEHLDRLGERYTGRLGHPDRRVRWPDAGHSSVPYAAHRGIANRMSGLQLLGRRIRTGERQVGDSAGRGDGLDLVVVL